MQIIPRRRRNELARRSQDIQDLWNRYFDFEGLGRHLPEAFQQKRFPPINLAETETGYEVTVEIPGMNEQDLDVQLLGDHLVISGERRWQDEEKTKEMHRVESEFGSFRRDIPLPGGLRTNPEDVKAAYKKGVLKVTVPKVEPTPANRIEIKVD